MSQRVRVLLADDHAPTREEVRFALEQDAGFEVCAEAADAPGAVQAALRARPDLCLLDIRMPGSGIAATWEIHARLPQTKIVMLTMSSEDQDLFASLRAGASGYLVKDLDPRRLPRALEAVMSGEAVLPRALVGRIVNEFRDRNARRRQTLASGAENQLTSREWQVLDLLREEMTTAQIARRLVLSPVTVRTHTNSIMRKLRVASREELLREFADER